MEKTNAKEVLVTFVGANNVVEHILSIKEKKTLATPKKKIQAKSVQAPESKNVEEIICEVTDIKHSDGPSGLCAQEDEMSGKDMFTFRTLKKQPQLLRRTSQMLTMDMTPRRLSKVGFSFETPLKNSRTSSAFEEGTPRSILKKTPSARNILNNPAEVTEKPAPKTPSALPTTSLDPEHPLAVVSTPKSRKRNAPRKTPTRLWRRNNAEAADKSSSDSDSGDSSTSDDDGGDDDDDGSVKDSKRSSQKKKVQSTPKTPVGSSGSGSSKKTPSSWKKLDFGGSTSSKQKQQGDSVNKTPRKKKIEECDVVTEKTSAESYFVTHHSSKATTSDRTLAKMEVPNLDPSEIVRIMSEVEFLYEEERASIYRKHFQLFDRWIFYMSQGFNILLHGLGSKMKLIDKFRSQLLAEFPHVVVNGFFPGILLKSVMSSISEALTGNPSVPLNAADQISHIRKLFRDEGNPDFFLIVHNIDGIGLRQEKIQQSLSLLCQIEGFHLVASIDHINAPLLWDHSKSSRFNWLWHETTTYEDYVEETSYENLILVKQSGSLALSSLAHVMKSLTPNAKGIFFLLAKYQLDSKDEPGYQGFAFPDLYQRCREAFLVNSEQTLRAQLVEFRDHKLVRTKTGSDGIEYVVITLEDSTLTTFMEQQEQQRQ